MKIATIIIGIVLFFGLFSTIFHDTALVGNIGKIIGDKNIFLFGYLAYINLLLLFYPLYLFFKEPTIAKRLDSYVGWILMLLSMILFQTLVVDIASSGYIGKEIYLTLLPFIGQAGLWLFWLMTFMLSLVLVIDDDYDFSLMVDKIRSLIEKRNNTRIKTQSETKSTNTNVSLSSVYSTVRSIFSNPFDVEKKREMDSMFEMNLNTVDDEDDGLTPTYRKKVPTKVNKKVKLRHKYSDDIEDSFIYSNNHNDEHSNNHLDEDEQSYADSYVNSYEDEDSSEHVPFRVKPKNTTISEDTMDEQITIKPIKKASLELEEEITAKHNSNLGVVIVDELEENSKILAQMDKGNVVKPKNFRLPRLDFLHKAPKASRRINEAEIDLKIGELLEKLAQFRISGDVVRTYSGPLVTTFEFKPAPNVKVSKILGLQDDLAMALSAETIRIQAPIPGRDVVGVEIPNESFDTIYLREILEHKIFKESKSELTIALGKDIVGKPFITDLKKLPHLLIAGTTGSGKSVGINAMILSLLYRNDPDHLKLVMIDPKMLEFSIYNDIPHLMTPVIIDAKKAIIALANLVAEMEKRYKLMAETRVKNIENYNEKAKKNSQLEQMPYIVIIIDELADLMMNGGKEVEYSIARLAQMARASGIHLIVATQRPSVDVVTGLIKANLPSRLSYRVGQRIDSKVILDQMGAESLLGRGDGLFTPPGTVGLVRIHAPWSTEEEIERIVDSLKAQREPEYDESIVSVASGDSKSSIDGTPIDLDALYQQAKEVVLTDQKTSISYLQRKLQIGYNRSANIIEQLQQTGVLSEPNAKGNREIL